MADHFAVFVVREGDLDLVRYADGASPALRFVDFANLIALLFELYVAALLAIPGAAKGATFAARHRFCFLFISTVIIGAAIDDHFDQMIGIIRHGEAGTCVSG